MSSRDYAAIASRVLARIESAQGRLIEPETTGKSGVFSDGDPVGGVFVDVEALRIIVDALWEGLSDRGVSWVGFYRVCPGAPPDQALTLGPSRDAPACSPIGLHGVCGQAVVGRRTMIVRDVAELGEGYVACDPRDRSEIVLPCYGGSDGGSGAGGPVCWGALDLDSHEVGAFDEGDERGLKMVLEAGGVGVGE